MKRIIVLSLLTVSFLLACASTGSQLSDYFFLHGGVLEEGPMGFVMTSPGGNALALREVQVPYVEELVCEFSLQTFEPAEVMNGFLVLVDRSDPGGTIVAGVYIGAGRYAIEGSGVSEPISVPVDFDPAEVFNVTVLVSLTEGYVELQINDRVIGTGLVAHMTQVDVVGYHANSTRTHFSEIEITGR